MSKLTPLQSVRRKCLECCQHSGEEVQLCPITNCPLYHFRMQEGHKGLIEAIKKKCLACGEGTRFEVKNCEFVKCPLYSFRLGNNPNRKGIGNLRHIPPPRGL